MTFSSSECGVRPSERGEWKVETAFRSMPIGLDSPVNCGNNRDEKRGLFIIQGIRLVWNLGAAAAALGPDVDDALRQVGDDDA